VRNSLIAKSIIFLLLNILSINSVLSKNIDEQLLSNKIEEVLNLGKVNLLKDIFFQKSFNKFYKHNKSFREKYKDAKWSIKSIENDKNKLLLDIKITSKREINDQTYNLLSKQIVKIETYKNKIKEYKIIDEESILKSVNSPLIIKVICPEKVFTGEKYEINLIIENPLGNSLTASGIIVIENQKNIKISNNIVGIKPNQSGGLFKYIQAPLSPGYQTISAIITHPEGIYSITKTIKVGS
tara:strand:- start:1153 stop:1872 length:720 start_codon:yes stop_codon:yes gene_type:complete